MKESKLKYLYIICLLLALLLILAGSVSAEILPEKVTIGETSLEGLDLAEAEKKLKEHFTSISFSYLDHYFTFSPEELGIKIDYQGTLKKLIKKPPWELLDISHKGLELEVFWTLDEEKLRSQLEKIAKVVTVPGKNATFTFKDGEIIISEGTKGSVVDVEFFKEHIKNKPLKNNYIIPVFSRDPLVTKKDLEGLEPTCLLSQFSSIFVKNYNRTENIRLASEKIKGTILAPGEVFSFNEVVGPRNKEAGFLMAMVISDGKFVPGLGGGICQVSSTLYNSVLSANLEVIERHSHSLPVTYVPRGKDATIAYGTLDFKFKNNTEGYILIDYKIEGQKLTYYLYGSRLIVFYL